MVQVSGGLGTKMTKLVYYDELVAFGPEEYGEMAMRCILSKYKYDRTTLAYAEWIIQALCSSEWRYGWHGRKTYSNTLNKNWLPSVDCLPELLEKNTFDPGKVY